VECKIFPLVHLVPIKFNKSLFGLFTNFVSLVLANESIKMCKIIVHPLTMNILAIKFSL